MRTQDEIFKRLKDREANNLLGFETSVYIQFLSFEYAKPLLKPETTQEIWYKIYNKTASKEVILSEMLEYMPFAWEKANDCRGISANRSIGHFEAWLWLMDDGFIDEFNAIEYEHYGKEKLKAICEKYGFDWKQWDNGVLTNYE
jgi:hypothetical protein